MLRLKKWIAPIICLFFLASCSGVEKETSAGAPLEAASVDWVENEVGKVESNTNNLDQRIAQLEKALGEVSPGEEEDSLVFKDVPRDYWAYTEIMELSSKNIIKGYPEQKRFLPENSITRYQAASMLVKALNLPLTGEASVFTDVPDGHPGVQEIMAVYKAGIFKGSSGSFLPNEPMKRRHMAMVLQRAFELKGMDKHTVEYSDVLPEVEGYDAIQIITQHGIAKGNEKGEFMPESPTKRSQFSAFIYRALENN